jgi:hypothetical protein
MLRERVNGFVPGVNEVFGRSEEWGGGRQESEVRSQKMEAGGGGAARGHPLDHVVVRAALDHTGLVIEGGRRGRLGPGAHRRQDIKPEREREREREPTRINPGVFITLYAYTRSPARVKAADGRNATFQKT